MLHRIFSYLWIAGAAFVVFFGLLFGIARVILNENPDYRQSIEQSISVQAGLQIKADRISPVWRSLSPGLRFENLRVSSPSGELLWRIDRLRVDVSIIRSLAQMTLVPTGILVDGTRLDLRRDTRGEIALVGLPESLAGESSGFELPRVGLTVINTRVGWTDAQAGSDPLEFEDVRIKIRPIAAGYRLRGRVNLPEPIGHRLRFGGKLRIVGGNYADASGDLYVKGSSLYLDRIAEYLPSLGEIGGFRGRADVAAWLTLKSGALVAAQTRLSVQSPSFQPVKAGLKRWDAATVSLVAGWRKSGPGSLIIVPEASVKRENSYRRVSGLQLAFGKYDSNASYFRAVADQLDIGLLASLLHSVPVNNVELVKQIDRLDPGGKIERFALALSGSDSGVMLDRIDAILTDASFRAAGNMPGLSGVTARIRGSEKHGTLILESHDSVFSMPKLFRNPLDINALYTAIAWDHSERGWSLQSGDVRIDSSGIRLGGRFQIDWRGDETSPFMDLELALRDGVVAEVPRYLPAHVMSPKAVKWLDHAMTSGSIRDGGVIVYGELGEFPFDHSEGVFQVDFNVENMILDYHLDWTRIEELFAEVEFHGRRMDIRANAGKMLDADLERVLVSIPDLHKPDLLVDGEVHGALRDMLQVVQDSPLKRIYGKALGPVSTEGDSDLTLQMTIPLHGVNRSTQVDGAVEFSDNRINFDAWKISLSDTEGTLRFSDRGLSAHDINAVLFEKPVLIDVAAANDGGTEVRAIGHLGLIDTVRGYDWPVLSAALRGESEWQMAVVVPSGESGSDELAVRLSSNLHGVTVDLPAPVGKSGDDLRTIVLETRMGGGNNPLDIRYGEEVSAKIYLGGQDGQRHLDRGTIRIGPQAPVVEVQQGLGIAVGLDEIDLPEWLGVLGNDSDARQEPAASAAETGTQAQVLQRLAVASPRVTVGDFYFPDMSIEVRPDGSHWAVKLTGGLVGDLRWPIDHLRTRSAQLRLTQTEIRRREKIAGPVRPGTAHAEDGLSPLSLPAINARLGNVSLDQVPLGNVTVVGVTRDDGLEFSRLSVDGAWMQLDGSGHWVTVDGIQRSVFSIDAKLTEMAQLLRFAGVSGEITGAATHAILEAGWMGSPFDFQLDKVAGDLSLDIGKGQLTEIEPGAGRLFGLMSVYALPRRLALDFRDVFEKGMGFDRIVGRYHLADGNAVTDGMVMQGPSARIEIEGRVGLRARDYDQRVVVIPKLGSTLPLAGALAAGPAVGAALLVADRLLSGPIEGITRYDYTLTGSWDNPDFKRVARAPIKTREPDPFAEEDN